MPGLDGTGPVGLGPGTGRGRGVCVCPSCGAVLSKVSCPECGAIITAGMEETDGWKGIRPTYRSPRKEGQDLTFPVLLKHDRVRVPDLKGREIGEIEKVYLDGSIDVKFPSEEKCIFIDVKGKNSVQKVGLKVGDRLSGGIVIKALHVNKDVGVYAATIVNDNGVEEVVVLENVEQI